MAKGSTVPVFVWALPSEAAPIYNNLTFVQMHLSGGRSLVSHYIAQPLLWVGAHKNYFMLELFADLGNVIDSEVKDQCRADYLLEAWMPFLWKKAQAEKI